MLTVPPVIRITSEDHILISFSVTCRSTKVTMLIVLPVIMITKENHIAHFASFVTSRSTTAAILTVLPVIRITSEDHNLTYLLL
jgi:hypothetical protein